MLIGAAVPGMVSSFGTVVRPDGIAVIEAVNGGHGHRLFAGQPGAA